MFLKSGNQENAICFTHQNPFQVSLIPHAVFSCIKLHKRPKQLRTASDVEEDNESHEAGPSDGIPETKNEGSTQTAIASTETEADTNDDSEGLS